MENRGIIKHFDKAVPAELKLVLRLAKDNGWWIYQRSCKKWYTPDEFRDQAFRLLKRDPRGHTNCNDFSPANPWDGLEARLAHLEKVVAETVSFGQRMKEHYKAINVVK